MTVKNKSDSDPAKGTPAFIVNRTRTGPGHIVPPNQKIKKVVTRREAYRTIGHILV